MFDLKMRKRKTLVADSTINRMDKEIILFKKMLHEKRTQNKKRSNNKLIM